MKLELRSLLLILSGRFRVVHEVGRPAHWCCRRRPRPPIANASCPTNRTIPALEDILVVSSSEARIEHYRREPDGWRIHDLRGEGSVRLEAFGISLDLRELYAGVLAPAGPQAQGLAGR